MKIVQFTQPTALEGCSYAPDQVIAFGNDALADALIAQGSATDMPDATVFVEHVDRSD